MSEKENLMKSGTATAAQIQAANDKIKAYKETVLQIEMSKKATGDSTANANISMALDNAEKIRSTGREKGQLVKVIDGTFKGVIGRVARWQGQQRVAVVVDDLVTVITAYVPSAFLMKLK